MMAKAGKEREKKKKNGLEEYVCHVE